ncbi:MAG TPA: flagellar protein FlgN [Gammaproteobacteria bacterium]|nr:flagellar protein FlgN [Gammaproteobacteria bacterium]
MEETGVQALHKVLDQQHHASGSLLAALEQEFAALSGMNLPALEQAARAKDQLTRELESLHQRQMTLLKHLNVSSRPGEIPDFAAAFPGSAGKNLNHIWHQTVARLQKCQDQNRVNGAVLAQSLRRTQSALAVLTQGETETGAYGPAGTASAPRLSRSLGST